MTEKFEPGDQVELTCKCHSGELATVGDSRGAPYIDILVHQPLGTLWSTGAHASELRLIARYADLVAEDDEAWPLPKGALVISAPGVRRLVEAYDPGSPFPIGTRLEGQEPDNNILAWFSRDGLVAVPNYLATDTIDATQEAIDRVRAQERQATQGGDTPLSDWEKALLADAYELPPIRSQVLSEADALINGDRQEQYGPPAVNFGRIADFWDTLVPRHDPWTPADVALAMVGLKLARAAQGYGRDTAVDGAGYLALWAELSEGQGR